MVAVLSEPVDDSYRTDQLERQADVLVLSNDPTLEPHALSICEALGDAGYSVWRSVDVIVSIFP